MPYDNVPENLWQKMDDCVQKVQADGNDKESAVAICYAAIVEGKADAASIAGKAGYIIAADVLEQAAKFLSSPIKAVGDWELDVLAAPFNKTDSDGQTFDSKTDFMLESFSAPVILYHHGIMPGKSGLQGKPVVIGKANQPAVKSDGLHVRVMLDKSLDWARRVWDAAKKGLAVASSDSIAHLARLEVGGKLSMYEKDKPGRIAVWPLAGLSLWDAVSENFRPASRYALALPAMKAIYREAGLVFPETTGGAMPQADLTAAKRARRQEIETFLSSLRH
jgi:hypothetical protein